VRRRAYFQINLAHLLGLVMLLGAIGVADLRTLGVGRRLSLVDMHRTLVPIGIAGLLLTLASGALLFAADARSLVGAGVFQVKILLIVLAIANALLFEGMFRDLSRGAPPMAKAMAAISLGLWLCVAAIGRLIGYV
jgi:uncharacterized membrane protein